MDVVAGIAAIAAIAAVAAHVMAAPPQLCARPSPPVAACFTGRRKVHNVACVPCWLTARREAGEVLGVIASGLRELVFPAACAGCGRAGALLCLVCAPRRPPFGAVRVDGVAVTAALDYADGLRAALLAYKEHDRRDLAAPLGALLRRSVDRTAPGVLVPVPSSAQAVRRRGGDHTRRLAMAAARGSAQRCVAALSLRRAVRDSAGLGVTARRANLAGAFVAAPPPRPAEHAIVVDDIVTTGATTAEAARALRLAGWQVSAAAVIAATPRRRTGRTLAGPRCSG